MAAEVLGPLEWTVDKDQMTHRDYTITWLVETDDPDDGPTTVLSAAGLPTIGTQWNFGNDFDPWALCWPNARCTPVLTGEPNLRWIVENKFSTRPLMRCMDTQIENPLAEPYRVSGGFFKKTKLVDKDQFGNPVRSSSQQRITGGVMEFDDNRPTVRVGFNQLFWPGALYADMVDSVNDAPLWGLPARCVKLSNGTWTRNMWGVCNFYFTVDYEFEIQYELDDDGNLVKTWDRKVHDKGTRCLTGYSPGEWEIVGPDGVGSSGHPKTNTSPTNPLTGLAWAAGDLVQPENQIDPDGIDLVTSKANYLNPKNFVTYRLASGDEAECFLDGKGRPVTDADSAAIIIVDYYKERNLLLLDIPSDLNVNLFP